MFLLLPLTVTEVHQEYLANRNLQGKDSSLAAQEKLVKILYSKGSKAIFILSQ